MATGRNSLGAVGAEFEAVRKAAHLAALNALAVAHQHLGSLDKVIRKRQEPQALSVCVGSLPLGPGPPGNDF